MDSISEKKKIGLVLEGGGMRGMYTAGVLDAFMLEGIEVDGVIGVSAGAVCGCSYISKQIGRTIRYNVKYAGDKRYASFESLRKTGDIFNVDFCYEQLPKKLNVFDYDTFRERSKEIPFYVTCTNLDTGKAEHIRCTDLWNEMDYMRASASMPLVSNIIEKDGLKLLDGGTADSIPIKFFESIGYEKNIVVLTRPDGYEKKQDPTIKLMKRMYKDYPNYVRACEERYKIYNEQVAYIEEQEKAGNVILIRPSRDTKIGRMEKNPDKLKFIYKLGRYDTMKKLDEIKRFMV